jgi:hypothetical protein
MSRLARAHGRRCASPAHTQRTAIRVAAFLVALALASLWLAAATPSEGGAPVAHAAERGLFDYSFAQHLDDDALRAAGLRDFTHLHTRWLRIDVLWSSLEPTRGAYDEAYVAQLDAAADDLHAAGISLLFTLSNLPGWAQDHSYDVPPGSAYPIRDDAVDDFGRAGEFMAAHFAGRVRALECWNEPNLLTFLYPQRTADDPWFAPRMYLRMLKAFSAGVRRGDASMLVVAGATAPVGSNDRNRTSPQRFARFLAGQGAAEYFDVYSHHPYTPGGTPDPDPEAAPADPLKTVTLRNLPTLLRLFPTKPFYLTEYGYNTSYTVSFGLVVTRVRQASYLRRAYAYVKRFKQVKMMVWFLTRDYRPETLPPEYGTYTGLREAEGERKLSWFAFSGGNVLTIAAPARYRPGHAVPIAGRLTNGATGAVSGRRLLLQSRRLSGSAWRDLGGATTATDGSYRFTVKPAGSRAYRVVWRGVKTSPSRTVRRS